MVQPPAVTFTIGTAMRASVEQIELWAAPSEHQRLEFKEAKSQYSYDKLCEYCVALANEGGGHLLLGVANKPPRPVVGTKAFPDTVDLANRLFNKLGFRVDVDDVAHFGGRVLVVSIPPRPRERHTTLTADT